MITLADALYETKYNPFKYGEYLASFYQNLTGVKDNFLLAQLVIPLCSHPTFTRKLTNAKFGSKVKSSIWTIFEDRTKLHDLQQRLDGFNLLTARSLEYCIVNDWVEIDADKLSISPSSDINTKQGANKSAAKLGKLFSHYSAIEIYTLLGVVPR